jgi:glutaryl-CoA dehydrogenase (non-decarboxylating)
MSTTLTAAEETQRIAFREFVEHEITPYAADFDRIERIPPALVEKLGQHGFLGASLPEEYGGRGLDALTLGLLSEEIGRGCSSVRSVITVHHMVAQAILKWGSHDQKQSFLPQLASGQLLAAFALSEPNVGSDAARVETSATEDGDSYILNGEKKWITSGQFADLFLVFSQCDGKSTAFLVPRNSTGFSVEAIGGLLGVRASMLAKLRMQNCRVPKANLVGRVGSGFSHVAAIALDYGRYSVAWGCVGITQACLAASLQYSEQRKQFGSSLKDHQLIRRMITDMTTNLRAARLLCISAAYLREERSPDAIPETLIAKYFASRAATKAASAAVQIHGAIGCSDESPISRYFRDARLMEIIEGSNEMLQLTIADYASSISD